MHTVFVKDDPMKLGVDLDIFHLNGQGGADPWQNSEVKYNILCKHFISLSPVFLIMQHCTVLVR